MSGFPPCAAQQPISSAFLFTPMTQKSLVIFNDLADIVRPVVWPDDMPEQPCPTPAEIDEMARLDAMLHRGAWEL